MSGFAYFNRPVAQVFLGDVGSLPIGLLLGWPAAASTTTTGLSRHRAVSRGRRMWCGGRRPNSEPLSTTSRRARPAAATRVQSAMRRKYPACDAHVTAYTESCRMSRPWLAEGKAGTAAQATSAYRFRKAGVTVSGTVSWPCRPGSTGGPGGVPPVTWGGFRGDRRHARGKCR